MVCRASGSAYHPLNRATAESTKKTKNKNGAPGRISTHANLRSQLHLQHCLVKNQYMGIIIKSCPTSYALALKLGLMTPFGSRSARLFTRKLNSLMLT